MLRLAQRLLVYNLLLSGVNAKDKVVLSDGVTFFQRFNGYSCYWNEYVKDTQWKRINDQSDPAKCANLCHEDERCTGFELSYSDSDPYCAFWYDGACGHEDMKQFIPYQYFGPKEATVATYVLMDGNARFYQKRCDYSSFNSSKMDKQKVPISRESTCTDICTENNNCTGSVAPVLPKRHGECKFFKDHSCTAPSIKIRGLVTTMRYPLTRDPPFSDAYGMCNPYSEVLRGYRTCAEYASAFPCDCDKPLGDMCTNVNVSAAGGKGYLWKHRQSRTCASEPLTGTWMVGSLSECKASCEAHSDCGCFKVGRDSNGDAHTCMLYHSTEVVLNPSVLLNALLGAKSDAYQLTRISYNPQATLSTLCPAECKAAISNASEKCGKTSEWYLYGASFVFLMVFTPIMFLVVVFMAIWTYVRRRCFLLRNQVPPPAPPMKKKDIDSMETEVFTSDSELKYGQIECSICLLDFENGDVMRVMKCGHRFHKECVDEWLSRYKSVCPLCKTDMRGNCETEGGEQVCPLVSGDPGDIEMGDMAPADSDSNIEHNPETPRTENPDTTPQHVTIDQSGMSNLNEPLLENEDEHSDEGEHKNLIVSDALESGDAVADMQPIVEEDIESPSV